jgi:hypothetical protein
MVKNIFNEDEQFIKTKDEELPENYTEFQEKIDNFIRAGRPDVGGGGSARAKAALVRSLMAPYTVWTCDPPCPELRDTTWTGRRTRTADSDHCRPGELMLPLRACRDRARRARIAKGAITDTSLATRPRPRAVQVMQVSGSAQNHQRRQQGRPLARARAPGPCQQSSRWGY